VRNKEASEEVMTTKNEEEGREESKEKEGNNEGPESRESLVMIADLDVTINKKEEVKEEEEEEIIAMIDQ
jgi:hypothetical protein